MVKKKKIKNYRKLTSLELQQELLKLFKANPKKRYTARQIIDVLRIENNKDSVQYALDQLSVAGKLATIAEYKYASGDKAASPDAQELHEGIVDMTRNGSAYIVCDNLEEDVYVPAKNMGGALHGDRVSLSVVFPRGRKPEGKIQKVLERRTEHFLGALRIMRHQAFLLPDQEMPFDIEVDPKDLKGAANGDKVVVKVLKWPGKKQPRPVGEITTVLGAPGSHDIEMKSVLINNGFNIEFPDEVLAEADKLSVKITKKDISSRRDMRNISTFTIDPEDAKDFDDALSIRTLENGNLEIGVHIADVSHYVHPHTALDKEAYLRSTSVYLVDRVCPMLPEKLSNELCSLRPEEDKLTFSAVFTFNEDDKLVDRWFGKTIIHSNRRFSYEAAQAVLDSGEGDFAGELRILNRIAYKLRKQRFKDGAIAFEDAEVRFRLDAESNPIEVYLKDRKDAHMLIEDFMLLANREVATFIHKKAQGLEIPFVYRIHDLPNMLKLEEFVRFAAEMGVKMDIQTPKKIATSFNRLAKEAQTNEVLKLLEPIAIRTMAKAVYSTNNIGHYGLAFDFYAHFTSPIRRYADVLAHRILEHNLEKAYRVDKEQLETQCKHISAQERKANEAERESIKYMQVVFLEKHLGDTFEGIITGMIDRGLFVALTESRCEGMVGFERMNESFDIDEGRLRARGRRTGKTYRMGDRIQVRIMSVDREKRQIEMGIVQ